jgi:hypothetical protein
MSVTSFETRAIRVRKATARIDPRFAALVAAMLAVFAGCFAIGHATDPNGLRGAGLPTLQAASRSVAHPIRLNGVPAIALPAVAKVAPERSLVRELFHGPLRAAALRPEQPTVSPVSEPAASPPQPAAAQSPTRAPTGSTSGPAGGEARRTRPSSGENGSFDNSG